MSLSSLCAQGLLSQEEWGSRGHASCCCWMACRRTRAEVSLSSICVQVRCSLCGVGQQRPCQLLLLDGLRGRSRAEVSLSSLCVQVLLSVWSEAAEAMPAVVAGWLAREEKS